MGDLLYLFEDHILDYLLEADFVTNFFFDSSPNPRGVAGRELRQASDIRKTAHVLGPIRALLKPFQTLRSEWDAFTLIELQSSKFARPFKLY